MGEISRRELLLSIPAAVMLPRIFSARAAQAGKPAVAVKTINHFALAVSDVSKSVDFYQGLFGMPIQQRQGSTVILRIGSGPQYMALTPAGANRRSHADARWNGSSTSSCTAAATLGKKPRYLRECRQTVPTVMKYVSRM